MSKTTLHKDIQNVVIGRTGKVPDTIEKLEKMREEFDNLTEKLDEKHFAVLPDQYTYTGKPFVFPILKSETAVLNRGEDDKIYIPSYMVGNEDLLSEAYNAVKIGTTIYSETHNQVTQAVDTENYVLKDDAYKVVTGGYCENQGNLIKLDHMDGYVYRKDVTKAYDTGRLELKRDLYKWTDGEQTRYYKYSSLSPDAKKKRLYFNEVSMPKPKDINETRIGIELEYSKAIDASRQALLSNRHRENWFSTRDGSIPEDGTEFVSVPFTYNELDEVSDFIQFCKNNKARYNKNCGYHVHIGSPELDFVSLTSVVLLGQNIQDDLFKLVSKNRQNNRYCKKLDESFRGFENVKSNKDEKKTADIFYEDAGTSYEDRHRQSKYSVNSKRHYWLSIDRFFRFKEEPHKRTVEFRMHHATHDSEEFIEFVLLCYYIVQFCIEHTMGQARSSSLDDVVRWIPNYNDRKKVKNLLTTKKVIEYV